MNADPQDGSQIVSGSTAAEPIYFDSGDDKLFGWLHEPVGGHTANVGLVICKPFGYEVMCSHTSLRAFADSAAKMGVPALRFDYCGTGDSADIDPQADQLQVWTKDVACGDRRTSATHRRRARLPIRTSAWERCSRCWPQASQNPYPRSFSSRPVISGRRYLRELRMTQLAAQLGRNPVDSSEKTTGEGNRRQGRPSSADIRCRRRHWRRSSRSTWRRWRLRHPTC